MAGMLLRFGWDVAEMWLMYPDLPDFTWFAQIHYGLHLFTLIYTYLPSFALIQLDLPWYPNLP